MNWAFWFMLIQIFTCVGGAIGFGYFQNNFWIGWVWFFYGMANIGFTMKALGY